MWASWQNNTLVLTSQSLPYISYKHKSYHKNRTVKMNEFLFIHSSASDPSSMLYVKSALLPILLLPSSLIIKCFLLAVRGKEKKKLRKIKIAERLKKVKSSRTGVCSRPKSTVIFLSASNRQQSILRVVTIVLSWYVW